MLSRLVPPIAVTVLWLGWSACSVDGPDFQGKTCDTVADCPSLYSCVPNGKGKNICNLGAFTGGPAAATVDYCSGAKAVLDLHCTLGCHGPDTAGSGQTSFRLDYYEPDAGDPVVGAFAKRDRIQARINNAASPMPPPPGSLSDDEKKTLNDWVTGGAPNCLVLDAGAQ